MQAIEFFAFSTMLFAGMAVFYCLSGWYHRSKLSAVQDKEYQL